MRPQPRHPTAIDLVQTMSIPGTGSRILPSHPPATLYSANHPPNRRAGSDQQAHNLRPHVGIAQTLGQPKAASCPTRQPIIGPDRAQSP